VIGRLVSPLAYVFFHTIVYGWHANAILQTIDCLSGSCPYDLGMPSELEGVEPLAFLRQ